MLDYFNSQIVDENERAYNQQLSDLDDYYTNLLKNTELKEDERAQIEADYQAKREEAEDEYNELKKAKQAKERQDELMETKMHLEATVAGIKDGLDAIGSAYSEGFAEIGGSLLSGFENITAALNNPELTGEQRAQEITNSSLQAAASVLAGVNDILNAVSEAQQAKTEEALEGVQSEFEAKDEALKNQLNNGLISQSEYDAAKYKMDVDRFNKEESIKKKAFEQDKKMKIAQATIAMIQGMLSAFAGAMTLGFPAGPIVGGLMAAAVGVMGGINIANIKKTKYEGGTPPSAPSAPQIATPQLASTMQDSGMTNEYSQSSAANANSTNNNNDNNPMVVKVESTVSVTELETTQNRVNKYEINSEL